MILHMTNAQKFKEAVRSLAAFAEDLWIQSEFYKAFILESRSITPQYLELLAESACSDSALKDAAHKLFARIFEVLDQPETRQLMEDLLKKPIPPHKPN
jgi:hypothetical protein